MRRLDACLAGLLAGAALATPGSAAGVKGLVDSSAFVELAGGDDAVTIEVNLGGSLLKALARVDPGLYELVGGVERIHAVILRLGDESSFAGASRVIGQTSKSLIGGGWERIARVREDDGDVQVLVLNDEESIQGLVVMAVNRGDGELIFANVAGIIDLAKLQALGERMEIPGLEELDQP
jgi:hypothetical protein